MSSPIERLLKPSSSSLRRTSFDSSGRTRLKDAHRAKLTFKLVVLIVALVIAIETQLQPVASNVINQQLASNNSNSQLPGLSERASNLNSRYLSAGSTTSLAAATAAAGANQSPQIGAQQSSGTAQQHQHHHHNQQQQQHGNQQAASSSQSVPAQAPIVQQLQQPNNAVQYSTVIQQQQQQQPQPQQQQHPLAGQYLAASPSDLGSANQLQTSLGSNFQSALPGYQAGLQQQQQQQFGGQNSLSIGQQMGTNNNLGLPYQTFSSSRQQQIYQRPLSFPFGHFAAPPPSGGQNFNQQRYQSAFTRRNGLVGGLRPQGNYPNGGLDEDSQSGLSFQQQQQFLPGSLSDQLATSLGLSLDPTYSSSSLPSPSNVYLQQQQNGIGPLDLTSGQSVGNVGLSSNQAGQILAPSNGNGLQLTGQSLLDYQTSQQHQQRSDQQCVAADGRHGTCYQASECIRRGGTPMGRCGGSSSASSSVQASEQLSGSSHVCCLFDVTCGQFAAERFVYFRNPGYPTNSYDQSRMCRAKIGKLDKGVCQFRLDMLRFDIAKPTNGNCSQDMFVVSGQNENYVIPKICGFNDGQHYYVGVDESGVITLHMMMMGYYRRSFEILITQIPCRSDFAAPAHCLQYFIGTHGAIKSFNYDSDESPYSQQQSGGLQLNNQLANSQSSFVNYDLQQDGSSLPTAPYGLQIQQRQQQQLLSSPLVQQTNRYMAPVDSLGGYPNDLDYTICIRKESGFCSITYQLSRTDHQGGVSPFAVGQAGGFSAPGGFNDTSSGWQSSAVSSDCRDDYLLIGGVRLCSGGGSNSFYDPYSTQGGGNASYPQQLLMQHQTQQLQAQQTLLMQQLARLNQQQQALVAQGQNVSLASGSGGQLNGSPLLSGQQQHQQQQTGVNNANVNGNNNNLEQQQAAIVQQLMLLQQQLNGMGNGGGPGMGFNQANLFGQQQQSGGDPGQGSIITDTTSGPFLLRFVSNNARNARGFHIDYRQNPCK